MWGVLSCFTCKCALCHNGCTFSTCQLPKVLRTQSVLSFFTCKYASRDNGVHFFDSSTSKSGPNVRCFDSVSRLRLRRLLPPHPPRPLSHTIFDTQLCHPQLCHTPSLTFTPSLSPTTLTQTIFHIHTIFVIHHLSHTTLSHTLFDTHHVSHTMFHIHTLSLRHPPSFSLRGRRGTYGTGLALVARVGMEFLFERWTR